MTRRARESDADARVCATAGFTLLELLVSFAIVGIVAALLYTSLDIATNSYAKGQKRMEEQARQRVLVDYMRRQLGSLAPVVPRGDFAGSEEEDVLTGASSNSVLNNLQVLQRQQLTQRTPLFEGTGSMLTFVTLAPLRHKQNPGLTVVTYGRAEDEYGNEYLGAMEMRYSGIDSFNFMASLPRGKPLPIVEGITDVKFSYYGLDSETGAYDWFDEWSGELMSGVPTALRIEFQDRWIAMSINATTPTGGFGSRSRLPRRGGSVIPDPRTDLRPLR